MILFLELLLVAVNLLIWLLPAAISLKRRTFSLIHPSIVFPLFLVISISVAMTEHWFHWSARGDDPGLRMTTRIYQNDPSFFITPLFTLVVAGLAFFAGIHIGCRRVVPTIKDNYHLKNNLPFVPHVYSKQLVLVGALFAPFCYLPYLIFGQSNEFFWTVALIYAFNFIPAAVYCQTPYRGSLFIIAGLLLVGLRGSKGDFIYYFLPLLFFFQQRLIQRKHKFSFSKILLVIIMVAIMVIGTINMHQARDEWDASDENTSLVQKIMVREYGFEVFAILEHNSNPLGNVFSSTEIGSWTVQEIREAVPGFIGLGKVKMGHVVASIFMPYDYLSLPEAGFYRFFLFPFYYDLGWPGAVVGSLLFGALMSMAYRVSLDKAKKKGVLWPLFLFLPVPVYSELLINGVYSYAIIHIGIAVGVMWLLARTSMLNIVGHRINNNQLN